MRGRGADPRRVVDYNKFAGQFPGTNQFSSQQPSAPTNPISAAPSSPMVGTGDVANVSNTPYPTTTVGNAGGGISGVGDTPQQALIQAASPTYGAASVGAVTNSNRTPGPRA